MGKRIINPLLEVKSDDMNIINSYRFGTTPTTNPDAFIMEFNMGAGETLTIPLFNTTGYNFTIDWKDGNVSPTITTYNEANRSHTYTNAGVYQIELLGVVKGIYFNNAGSKLKLTKIIQWGNVGFTTFQNAFFGCNNLTFLPTGSITGASEVSVSAFYWAFRGCTSLKTISSDLFKLCISISSSGFYGTFQECDLDYIPTDLFRYNTSVSSSGFYQTFHGCTSLTSIPTDLFRYNTAVSTYGFYSTFYGCTSLTSIPTDLFRYNTAVSSSGFNNAFYGCTVLNINDTIFYAAGEQATRFINKTSDFTSCFYRTSFSGTQGTAPDLWNCDYGETITLDVSPTTDWAVGDIITGQTSGATSEVVSKTSSTVYKIKKHFGTYTVGEIIGVTGNADKLADQGAAKPTFTGTPVSTSCFGGAGNSTTSLTNYNDIPASWK